MRILEEISIGGCEEMLDRFKQPTDLSSHWLQQDFLVSNTLKQTVKGNSSERHKPNNIPPAFQVANTTKPNRKTGLEKKRS